MTYLIQITVQEAMPVLHHGFFPIGQRLHLRLLPEPAVWAETLHLLHEGDVAPLAGGASGMLRGGPRAAGLDGGLHGLAGPPHPVGHRHHYRRLATHSARAHGDGTGHATRARVRIEGWPRDSLGLATYHAAAVVRVAFARLEYKEKCISNITSIN